MKHKIITEKKKYIEENINEMYDELDLHKKSSENETTFIKNYLSKEINAYGKKYLAEIDKKHGAKEQNRLKKINYILCHSKNKYKKDELYDLPLEDIQSIYIKVRKVNKLWYNHLIEFLMGWNDNRR